MLSALSKHNFTNCAAAHAKYLPQGHRVFSAYSIWRISFSNLGNLFVCQFVLPVFFAIHNDGPFLAVSIY